jgi:hypothetical protein
LFFFSPFPFLLSLSDLFSTKKGKKRSCPKNSQTKPPKNVVFWKASYNKARNLRRRFREPFIWKDRRLERKDTFDIERRKKEKKKKMEDFLKTYGLQKRSLQKNEVLFFFSKKKRKEEGTGQLAQTSVN